MLGKILSIFSSLEIFKFAFCFFSAFSMASPALLMRVVASAYSVAEKAATIVRNVMSAGDLGIVEKVLPFTLFQMNFTC